MATGRPKMSCILAGPSAGASACALSPYQPVTTALALHRLSWEGSLFLHAASLLRNAMYSAASVKYFTYPRAESPRTLSLGTWAGTSAG